MCKGTEAARVGEIWERELTFWGATGRVGSQVEKVAPDRPWRPQRRSLLVSLGCFPEVRCWQGWDAPQVLTHQEAIAGAWKKGGEAVGPRVAVGVRREH